MLSSQIEGTQSSVSDLLLSEMEEAPGVPVNDVVEVSNYVAALPKRSRSSSAAARPRSAALDRATTPYVL